MENENTNRQNNRQPSMRELANERMRKMREERENAGQRPAASNEERRTSSERQRPCEAGHTTSDSARSSRESRQILPENAREKRPGETRQARPSNASADRDGVRRSGEVRQTGPSGASSEKEGVRRSGEARQVRPSNASADRDGARRSSEARQTRPSGASSERSSASRRPAARDAIETERRTSRNTGNKSGRSSSSSGRNTSSRQAPKKKKSPVFWICFGIYTAILLILSFVFLKYTDVCLNKYENSQSENYMAEYIKDFEKRAKENTLSPSDFTFASLDMTFVDSDILLKNYIEDLGSYSSFEAEKDPTSYITEAPVYNITADGEPVARVTLKAISQTKIFAILTIMDWDIDTVEPVCSINLTNYTFSIPEGYTPVIDGITVGDTYRTGNVEEIPEFKYVSNYVKMPEYVEYKVENVPEDAEIKVLNNAGEEVATEKNGNRIRASYALASSTLSEDRKNEALSMIQTYEDFNTSDLSGPNHGLATVQAFLIKDSDYWNMAKQWAGGVDITFTSAHVFADPKYSNVVVDNYVEYSDVCYSLHIAFSKNMILTRTKETISNDFDSTVFFIYYDDSDDGTDNPHWCIADMIATTN